jgi:hypothetical protein
MVKRILSAVQAEAAVDKAHSSGIVAKKQLGARL